MTDNEFFDIRARYFKVFNNNKSKLLRLMITHAPQQPTDRLSSIIRVYPSAMLTGVDFASDMFVTTPQRIEDMLINLTTHTKFNGKGYEVVYSGVKFNFLQLPYGVLMLLWENILENRMSRITKSWLKPIQYCMLAQQLATKKPQKAFKLKSNTPLERALRPERERPIPVVDPSPGIMGEGINDLPYAPEEPDIRTQKRNALQNRLDTLKAPMPIKDADEFSAKVKSNIELYEAGMRKIERDIWVRNSPHTSRVSVTNSSDTFSWQDLPASSIANNIVTSNSAATVAWNQ